MTVARSHEIRDRIEEALKASPADPVVTIHVEPHDKAERVSVGAISNVAQPIASAA